MSGDNGWMHRAFPTLAPAEAEEIVHDLGEPNFGNLQSMVEAAAELEALPHPPSSSFVEEAIPEELFHRFVFGNEPLPDLATAEVVRRELQRQLNSWAKDFCKIQSISVSNVLGKKVHRPDAHRRRFLLWRLCDGQIARTGVVKDLARQLDKAPQLCEEFGFHVGTSLRDKRKRIGTVRELIKEMRASLKAGLQPYTLTLAEEEAIGLLFEFEDLGSQD